MTRIPWTILVFLSALLILVATMLPGSQFHDFPGYFNMPGIDKVIHFILFAFFSFVYFGHLYFRKKLKQKSTFFFKLLIIGTVFGLSTEFFQFIFPLGRNASLYDILADLMGVLFGFVAGIVLLYKSKPSSPKDTEQKVTMN